MKTSESGFGVNFAEEREQLQAKLREIEECEQALLAERERIEEAKKQQPSSLRIEWNKIQMIGWLFVGAGCERLGWIGPDRLFGTTWGVLAIGCLVVIAAWVFEDEALPTQTQTRLPEKS